MIPRISCREVAARLTDWMEGALDEKTVAEIDEHLAGCASCEEYVAQLRTIKSLAADLDADGDPIDEERLATLLAAFRAARRPDR